jgi:hypothetical protein
VADIPPTPANSTQTRRVRADAIPKNVDDIPFRLYSPSEGDAQFRAERAARLIKRAEELHDEANELIRQAEELLPDGETLSG